MGDVSEVSYRRATRNDVDFLCEVLVSAAVASGVDVSVENLCDCLDAYQYVVGFPNGSDVGVVAETDKGVLVGAAWVRLLHTDAHAVNEPLPELTMGVIPEYRHRGIGQHLLKELYQMSVNVGINKISLGVHCDNRLAVNLYRQQDWLEDGYFNEYIMMSKKLL